jgi:hypothetical protein
VPRAVSSCQATAERKKHRDLILGDRGFKLRERLLSGGVGPLRIDDGERRGGLPPEVARIPERRALPRHALFAYCLHAEDRERRY